MTGTRKIQAKDVTLTKKTGKGQLPVFIGSIVTKRILGISIRNEIVNHRILTSIDDEAKIRHEIALHWLSSH